MTAPMQNITKVTIEFGSGEALVMEPGMEVDFILGVATNVQKTKEGYVADIPYVVTGRGDILRRIFFRLWERNPILLAPDAQKTEGMKRSIEPSPGSFFLIERSRSRVRRCLSASSNHHPASSYRNDIAGYLKLLCSLDIMCPDALEVFDGEGLQIFYPTGWQYGASEERLAMVGFRGAQGALGAHCRSLGHHYCRLRGR